MPSVKIKKTAETFGVLMRTITKLMISSGKKEIAVLGNRTPEGKTKLSDTDRQKVLRIIRMDRTSAEPQNTAEINGHFQLKKMLDVSCTQLDLTGGLQSRNRYFQE